MRIFALDTDLSKLQHDFCHGEERVQYVTHYHGFCFIFGVVREMVLSLVLISFGVGAWMMDLPLVWTSGILFSFWFVFAFFGMLKAFLDWQYDLIIVTTDKVILVDQTSLFRREVKPVHLDNIGAVSSRTQFWGLFPFGRLQLNLKEGLGGDDITKYYVPSVERVASIISQALTEYQRRNILRQQQILQASTPTPPPSSTASSTPVEQPAVAVSG